MLFELHESSFGLLTLHGKETLIAPLLKESFGASLVLTQAFDTDTLGTFSGEVERQLAPYECALKKAQLACDLTGLTLGLGSEGSFGPSPYGFGVFNHELVACVNRKQGWSVIGHCYDFSHARSEVVTRIQQLKEFLQHTPADQGLILKSSTQLEKGLYGFDIIEATLVNWFGMDIVANGNFSESVTLSYDLRAHHCPERRGHIIKATENLIARLKSPCPKCKTPGFWQDQHLAGLPCYACGTLTPCIKTRIANCAHCHHSEATPVKDTFAEPRFCPYCNP